MAKTKSSEERFNIPKQPSNTCPDIDGLLTSINDIGEEDENGEIVEISPDWSSWDAAKDNVFEIKYWQESWIDIGEQLEDKLVIILKSIDKINNDSPKLTLEDKIHYEIFSKDEYDLIHLKELLSSHIKEWKSEIKSLYYDLEYSHDAIIHSVENNETDSPKSIESYRSLVEDFRSLGNSYKEIIRDNSYTLLPELCDNPSFEEIYDDIIEKKDADLLQFLDTKNQTKLIKKNKNRVNI